LEQKSLLMIPGPTPCPDRVLRALSQPMINHRGPEYMALQRELIAGLKAVFRTEHELLIFPASGTGGLEAAVANTLSPGDPVLAVTIGAFGERFAEIAEAFGADVRRLAFDWGRAADPGRVRDALRERPVKALLLTHNETSTGVLNDLPALAQAGREHGALLLVDSISGMIAADVQTDAWDLDVVVAGSQKAWMIPPGLTFLSVSPRAWEAHQQARMARFYFDFTRMRRSMERDQTPYTPALPQLFGLRESLSMLLEEGLDASFLRHERLARAVRAGVTALGLPLFAEPAHASPALTAVGAPEGVEARELRRRMREQHGVVIAGGQGAYQDRLFRIGHLGYVAASDIVATLAALERTLIGMGWGAQPGAAVAAAERALAEASGHA
jgi:aspartate aminotransferase-like enzyme